MSKSKQSLAAKKFWEKRKGKQPIENQQASQKDEMKSTEEERSW